LEDYHVRIALLPDWVSNLPLQQQAVLVLALRGPDGFPKHHASKPILWFLRACVLRAAHTGNMMQHGEHIPTFMSMLACDDDVWAGQLKAFREVEDELPLHYYTHLMHAAQVLAYKHEDKLLRARWAKFYQQCCEYLHCRPEGRDAMDARLNDFGRTPERSERVCRNCGKDPNLSEPCNRVECPYIYS
jgi:hypothetical protein